MDSSLSHWGDLNAFLLVPNVRLDSADVEAQKMLSTISSSTNNLIKLRHYDETKKRAHDFFISIFGLSKFFDYTVSCLFIVFKLLTYCIFFEQIKEFSDVTFFVGHYTSFLSLEKRLY